MSALRPVPECVRDVILEVDNFFRDESVLQTYLSSSFSSGGTVVNVSRTKTSSSEDAEPSSKTQASKTQGTEEGGEEASSMLHRRVLRFTWINNNYDYSVKLIAMFLSFLSGTLAHPGAARWEEMKTRVLRWRRGEEHAYIQGLLYALNGGPSLGNVWTLTEESSFQNKELRQVLRDSYVVEELEPVPHFSANFREVGAALVM